MRRLAALLCALLLTAGCALAEGTPTLQIHQINNGCADAYLLVLGGRTIMIDGGADTDSGAKKEPTHLYEYLDATGVEHFDLYIVTHYHLDHAGYLHELLARYGGEETVVLGPSPELPERFLPLPAGTYRQLACGDQLALDDLQIRCIGQETLKANGEINNDSLNFIVQYGARRILFTGDGFDLSILKRCREEITDIDVLKFPHHGLNIGMIPDATMALMRPKIILVPGNMAAQIKVHVNDFLTGVEACGIENNKVVLTDGQSLEIVADVKPGDFTVTR